jgi:hypothetical protein
VIVQKDDQYAVECFAKASENCIQNGEYCDSEEEAIQWVEYECWIFSGEGWICDDCHDKYMENMVKMRKIRGSDGIEGPKKPEGHDGLDGDLEVGIDIVR